MKAVVFAYSDIGVESLQTLVDSGVQVVGVVTHADNPEETRWFRSVEELARAKGIPVTLPEDPNTSETLQWVASKKPDILFSFYYRKMLKKPLLETAPKGAFNLHGSLLPKFRGRAPVNWAIIEGATETGLTLHEMIEKADAGSIVAQVSVPISENENARQLFEKLVPLARQLLVEILPKLADGSAPRTPQDDTQATTFGARTPEDGRVDWQWPARRIHNLVRALERPYPGAFTSMGGRKIFIWKGRILPDAKIAGRISPSQVRSPGQVLDPWSEGVPVQTGEGIYLIQEVQIDGGAVQHARDVLYVPSKILQ